MKMSYDSSDESNYSLAPESFDVPANPIQNDPIFLSRPKQLNDLTRVPDEKHYVVETAKKTIGRIEDAIVDHIAKNVEGVFTTEGVIITDDVKRWTAEMVRQVLLNVVAEL